MVCGLDDAVGTLLAELEKHALAENTLVFFFSDNGGPVGVTNCRNTPLRGAKGQVYEGGVRVPFVVRWPAKLKPGKYEHPVASLDVFPTALAAAGGAPFPETTLDGVDLLPHLTGTAATSLQDRTLFWRTGGGKSFAVRRGNAKWVKNGDQPAELYDLAADIGETTNLAAEQKETAAALQQACEAWNRTLVAPLWGNPTPAKKR